VSSVDVVFEQLVLSEGGRANGALVGQVSRFQRLAVVLGNVVQQLPLINLEKIKKTSLKKRPF
jgi:hypothetical protein